MNSLVITPRDASEMQFITALLQRLGIGIAEVPGEELEDAVLLNLLQKVDVSDTVSRDEIFRKLKTT